MKSNLKTDIFVIDMGSSLKSKYSSFDYEDGDYRGKCYGHNVGLRLVKANGNYRYYWILMNDLIFKDSKSLEEAR